MKADRVSELISPKSGTRPSQAQLQQQGILAGGANPYQTANALQATQRQLERQLKTDAVSKGLATRAAKDTTMQSLKQQGMTPNVDPALAATYSALERQLKTDKLKQNLEKHESRDALQQKGVLSKVDASLAATQKQLELRLKMDKLSKSLSEQPPVSP